MRLITCEKLNFKYDNLQAISNVNFYVDEGDYLCIVGENGSGKTTLIKCLLGLIKQESGEINFTHINKNEIGYLPQHTVTDNDFPASVFEVVISGRLNKRGLRPYYNNEDKESVMNNLEKLNIADLKNISYRNLSGGQKQRVLLARALCASERLLILDEPINGLDPVIANEFSDIIKNLNKDKLTIIMVSHDIRSALTRGNKILHLHTTMQFFGSTGEYRKTDMCNRLLRGYHYA
ncbi:MAG: ATP-binding cassette domain-containing protein [Oscillospiraceae bacterium]|nr:ATP-binding cassette domain-containing protein [Oscillospiraceae bacterium]